MASHGSANFYQILENDMGQNQKTKKKRTMMDREYPTLDSPQTQNMTEPKYITISTADTTKTLADHNEFVVKKAVESISKQYSKATYLRDGSLLLLCDNGQIADRFTRAKQIAGISIVAKYHDRLNSSKGTVYARNMNRMTEKEILEGLEDQGVTEVVQIKRTVDGQSVPTGLLILTFKAFKTPTYVNLGFLRAEVREYIPNPMRCRKCQLIGHTQKWCKDEEETCEKCAEVKPHEPPCTKSYCVNCKKPDHGSNDPKCPEYLRHKEYNKIRVQRRCTLYEAKQYFYKMNPGQARVQMTYAQATKAQPPAKTIKPQTEAKQIVPPAIEKTKQNDAKEQTNTSNINQTETNKSSEQQTQQIDLTIDSSPLKPKTQNIKEHATKINQQQTPQIETTNKQKVIFDFSQISASTGEKTTVVQKQQTTNKIQKKNKPKKANTTTTPTDKTTTPPLPSPRKNIWKMMTK